jgi:serine-type D-Ala-D-Ala carboxypeptidase/endopeptidase (penicillin-binding protein 4)
MKYPSGWIWEDIGNYYGASHGALNWKENKFDLYFNTGNKPGDPVVYSKMSPWYIKDYSIHASELLTAAKGSGDNAFAFLQPASSQEIFVKGTLPAGEKNYSISVSHPDPAKYLSAFLKSQHKLFQIPLGEGSSSMDMDIMHIHHSPILDSINHYFLRKSINLYGEALIKTLGARKFKIHSTENGVRFLKDFWESKGIEASALQLVDGSGLSPLNRVTPAALAAALKFARSRTYYSSLLNAFPLINGIRMKSGTISGAKSYAGYIRSSSGKEYIFSIMVNNYDGSSGAIVKKMFAILDQLK